MAFKQTTEDPDRYINTDLVVTVQQNGSVRDILVYADPGGQFVIGSYASRTLAETALATLVLTF